MDAGHINECEKHGNVVLRILSGQPPAEQPRKYIKRECSWSSDELSLAAFLGFGIFRDVVALLLNDGYICEVDGRFALTIAGRAFYIKGGYTVTENSRTRNTPTKKTQFKPGLLSRNLQTALIDIIRQRDAANDPKRLVDFLSGMDDGMNIVIKEKQARFISYLLYLLYQKGKLRLFTGKGYQHYAESKIFAFSPGIENAKIKNYVDGINKSPYAKHAMDKSLKEIIKLISA